MTPRIVPVVNGRPLYELGRDGVWGDVKFSHGWPYGSLRASWGMREGIRNRNLFWGAQVRLLLCGITIWRGFLNEPGRDGAMTALGSWELGKGAMALTSTGGTTAEPRDAIAQAIARDRLPGWSSVLPDIYPGTAAQQMDAPYPAQFIAQLLDAVTREQGTRWWINPLNGRLIVASDPTVVKWVVPHQVAGQGLTPASDDVATHLYGEFITGPGQRDVTDPIVSPDYITGAPAVEDLVDLIDKGFLTEATAEGYLTAMHGTGVGKVGWADGLALGRGDVYTTGGTLVDPALVIAGPDGLAQLAGVWDDRAANPAAATRIVVSETEYDSVTDRVQVKPVGLARRTLGEVMTWLSA